MHYHSDTTIASYQVLPEHDEISHGCVIPMGTKILVSSSLTIETYWLLLLGGVKAFTKGAWNAFSE